jgi:predicted nucleic acid-binding protein
MARGILLDTSTWICYLRPHGWDDLKLAVPQVRTVAPVSTCWVVMAELLIGARDERGLTPPFEPLRALPEMPVTHQLWDAAARLGYPVRRRGITMPLSDLVSAQAAITGDLTRWHVDEHVEHLRRHSTLQTQSVVLDARG